MHTNEFNERKCNPSNQMLFEKWTEFFDRLMNTLIIWNNMLEKVSK